MLKTHNGQSAAKLKSISVVVVASIHQTKTPNSCNLFPDREKFNWNRKTVCCLFVFLVQRIKLNKLAPYDPKDTTWKLYKWINYRNCRWRLDSHSEIWSPILLFPENTRNLKYSFSWNKIIKTKTNRNRLQEIWSPILLSPENTRNLKYSFSWNKIIKIKTNRNRLQEIWSPILLSHSSGCSLFINSAGSSDCVCQILDEKQSPIIHNP